MPPRRRTSSFTRASSPSKRYGRLAWPCRAQAGWAPRLRPF
jgi:hypothetical protein